MPPDARPRHGPHARAADALAAVAPPIARWIERLLAAHEPPLGLAQYLALRAVTEPGTGGRELARRAGVSEAAASQLLAGLERAGLIARSPDPADRRRQRLALTGAGAAALRSADALLRRELGALIGDLPGPEADALARSLSRVAALVGGTPPPRLPRPPHPPPLRPPAPGSLPGAGHVPEEP
jgi:DNA-binding MarR family transcriptional regulator